MLLFHCKNSESLRNSLVCNNAMHEEDRKDYSKFCTLLFFWLGYWCNYVMPNLAKALLLLYCVT